MAKTPAINVAVVVVTPVQLFAPTFGLNITVGRSLSIAPAYQRMGAHRSRIRSHLSDACRKIRGNADDQSRVVSGTNIIGRRLSPFSCRRRRRRCVLRRRLHLTYAARGER